MSGALNAIIAQGFDPSFGQSYRDTRDRNITLDNQTRRTDEIEKRTAIDQEYARQRGAAFEAVELERQAAAKDQASLAQALNLYYDKSLTPETEAMQGQLGKFADYAQGLRPELMKRAGQMFGRGTEATLGSHAETLAERRAKAAELFRGTRAGQATTINEIFGQKTGFRPLSQDEVSAYGLDPEKAYQIGADNKIHQIGGNGTNVTIEGDAPDFDPLDKEIAKRFAEEGQAIAQASDDARATLGQIDRMRMLQRSAESGLYADEKLFLEKAANMLGVENFVYDGSVGAGEAMRSLGTDFVLGFTERTKGAISEAEMDLFAKAAPGLGNTPEGNALILDMMERIATRQIEVDQLRSEFMMNLPASDKTNAQYLWRQRLNEYHQNNPIFSEGELASMSGVTGAGINFGSAAGQEEGDLGDLPGGIEVVAKMVNGKLVWVKSE